MITIAICEDEAFFASGLKRLVRKYSSTRNMDLSILTCSSGEQLLAFRQMPALILMDVRLPGRDGMETIRKLRDLGWASQVIFITAYPEYVFQAFDLDAVHYILKPVTAEALFPALDRAVKRAALPADKAVLLTNGTSSMKIPMGDILYCEALGHQITVHTPAGRFQFFGTLDAMQEKLDGRFFRCHRSFLVNLARVASQRPGTATVDGGGEVLISRRKQREFTRRLLELCREELV